MATNVSNKTWFNNAIVGTPQVGHDVNIYEVSENPKYAIGTGFERSDGCVFRYSRFGDKLHMAGLICAQNFDESGTTQIDSKGITKQNCTQIDGEQFDVNTTGAYYMQFGLGAIEKDQYAGGYICISHDSSAGGEFHKGHTYRIKGNTATGTPEAGQMYFQLYSPLQGSVGDTTDINIVGCKWDNIESASGATDIVAAGVNCAIVDTANRFGWVQTRGPVGIQCDTSFPSVAGDMVVISSNDTGQVRHASASLMSEIFDEPTVGYCIDPGAADNELALIELQL